VKKRAKNKGEKRQRYKWGAFVCHVTADKKAVVTPLGKELQKFGVNVWLDEFILKVGDSLRQKIDEGLSKSRYGVVVFSPSFFQKKWPQAELDGLFAREMGGKRKVILPIRHQISIEELIEKVPLLAGKCVLDSSKGVSAIARKLVEVIRPEALKLDQSQADVQKTNARLLEQLEEFGKNPTVGYRVSSGQGVTPKKFDLESLEKTEVKDAIGSIYHSGLRIDLVPKDRNEYRKNPVTFKLRLQDAGVKKLLKAMQTGRTQEFTAGEFSNLKLSLELFPSAVAQKLVIKPIAGKTIPVRVTFGNDATAVVYDFMTHRTVRAGTLEAHSTLSGKDVPFVVHLRMKRKTSLDVQMIIEPELKGKSIRFVHKFVQMKRALWESGKIEIFDLESGTVRLAGELLIPAASETELGFGRMVDDLAMIADFFGIDLKWPKEITETDKDVLVLLKWMREEVLRKRCPIYCGCDQNRWGHEPT
jgi:TIR domain